MLLSFIPSYTRWLHTRWPAGLVEKLPVVNPDGSTNVPGIYVVGDLAGIPLLKFSSDTGAKAARLVSAQLKNEAPSAEVDFDLIIIGGGVSGMAAALEAGKLGLKYVLLEAAEPLSTIVNFPKAKPIYTYPTEMIPEGDLQFTALVKEPLLDEIKEQIKDVNVLMARAEKISRQSGVLTVETAGDKDGEEEKKSLRAHRVVIAIGRSGNYRKLGAPGEELPKVYNRLHDPKEYAGQNVLVIGGGDSALETAIAIAQYVPKHGGKVTLSYRKPEFARPKPDNIDKLQSLEKAGAITIELGSSVKSINDAEVVLIDKDKQEKTLTNDSVFAMIGREPPLDFFRRSGLSIHGDHTPKWWITICISALVFLFIYHWKKSGVHITGIHAVDQWLDLGSIWSSKGYFPYNISAWWAGLGGWFADKTTLLGTMKITIGEPGFWYSLIYCLAIIIFGIRRIRRRKTPYVTIQTVSLTLLQCIPLFLLPFLVLPWLGNLGAFNSGVAKSLADEFFPAVDYGHGREYWRAIGFILAWPLFIWNIFTDKPMWGWLIVSVIQTFVLIPVLIYYFGKGIYCGWICSCGALAETVGDQHRTKMPHGPFWNRLNMIGQVFLAFAFVLLGLRILGWIWPQSFAAVWFSYLLSELPIFNYAWFVDLLFAGVIGVAFYFHFSGRVWCRFACPLAALMHIYTRFSRFAIVAEKKKCISCNVCTTVCHQGIDVMSFANKGHAMQDPQCVRCSACVQSCPTGVLSFGQVDGNGETIWLDPSWLAASPVLMRESSPVQMKVNGKVGGRRV